LTEKRVRTPSVPFSSTRCFRRSRPRPMIKCKKVIRLQSKKQAMRPRGKNFIEGARRCSSAAVPFFENALESLQHRRRGSPSLSHSFRRRALIFFSFRINVYKVAQNILNTEDPALKARLSVEFGGLVSPSSSFLSFEVFILF